MFGLCSAFYTLFPRALKHPRRGAYQLVPRFAYETDARARRNLWPFNAPRPQWAPRGERNGTTPVETASANSSFDVYWPEDIPLTDASEPEPDAPRPCEVIGNGYIRLGELGSSSEGVVSLAKHFASRRLVAVKSVASPPRTWCRHHHDHDHHDSLPGEVLALSSLRLNHPNIIEVRDCFAHAARWHIVLEYCSGGNVGAFIAHWERRSQPVPELFLLHFLASMAEALGFLHCGLWFPPDTDFLAAPVPRRISTHRPLLHRDIKPENILLRWSPRGGGGAHHGVPDIVLADFGHAVLERDSRGYAGTPEYYPPECVRADVQRHADPAEFAHRCNWGPPIMSPASDVYCAALSVCELLLLPPPEADYRHDMDVEAAFRHSTLAQRKSVLRCLRACLADEPGERPTSRALCYRAAEHRRDFLRLHASGVRMPPDSWPSPHFWTPMW